tara:strand:- start:26 stop:334 length:309 start_codon:yes stop_codon:yes gene_type:complete
MEEVNKKIDKLDNHMEAIKHLLITLNDKVESLESKVEDLNDKVDEEVLEECKKMGSHIDFVENVYDNVKHPLGYICKKIKGLTGTSDDQYTLTDLEDKDEVD